MHAKSAIGGFGLGLIMWVLEVADVNIPREILITLALIAIAMVLYGGWPIARWLWQRAKRVRFQNPIVVGKSNQAHQQYPNRLEEALNGDKDSLGKRIYWREYVWLLDGITKTDPYIELIFRVINAAVFSVAVIGIKGRFLIDGQECAQSAEIGGKTRIPHGESGNLCIKQHLSTMMASLLREGVSKINLDSLQLIVQPEIGFETFGTSINITVGGEYDVGIPRP